jgi:hypothetical protein
MVSRLQRRGITLLSDGLTEDFNLISHHWRIKQIARAIDAFGLDTSATVPNGRDQEIAPPKRIG